MLDKKLTKKEMNIIKNLVLHHEYHKFRDTVLIVRDDYTNDILLRNVRIMQDDIIPMFADETLIDFYGREQFYEEYKQDPKLMADAIMDRLVRLNHRI